MTVQDILTYSGGGLVLLLTLIQITPIKLNPWSWLANKIGRAFNHDVITKLDDHDKKLSDITKDVQSIKDDVNQNKADQCRQRILRFNDEILHKVKHTKEYFDDLLIDVDDYETYCKAHPGYKNSRAEMAIENIKDTYKKLSKEGGFL